MSSRLSPSYIIPVGTQVVLKRNHPVVGDARAESGERVLKKAGSAGEIRSAPMTHDNTYEVHFADGHQVHATRDDLTILRTHAPEHSLGGREITAYEPYVIYRVIAGSHAYGLADEHSDRDERGVYVPPAAWHWSLQPLPQQIEWKRTANGTLLAPHCKADADDVCWWELEKFLRLALKANPTVLEVLFVPERQICAMDTIGERLRAIRHAFLSQYVYQTYSGYVLSQFCRMQKQLEKNQPYRPQHAMHLIRLLHAGIATLESQDLLIDVGVHRDELVRIKHGHVPFAEVYQRALELDRRFQVAFAHTALPERPDVDTVDQFLIWARRQRT